MQIELSSTARKTTHIITRLSEDKHPLDNIDTEITPIS
jgi:hypothetical protein